MKTFRWRTSWKPAPVSLHFQSTFSEWQFRQQWISQHPVVWTFSAAIFPRKLIVSSLILWVTLYSFQWAGNEMHWEIYTSSYFITDCSFDMYDCIEICNYLFGTYDFSFDVYCWLFNIYVCLAVANGFTVQHGHPVSRYSQLDLSRAGCRSVINLTTLMKLCGTFDQSKWGIGFLLFTTPGIHDSVLFSIPKILCSWYQDKGYYDGKFKMVCFY